MWVPTPLGFYTSLSLANWPLTFRAIFHLLVFQTGLEPVIDSLEGCCIIHYATGTVVLSVELQDHNTNIPLLF